MILPRLWWCLLAAPLTTFHGATAQAALRITPLSAGGEVDVSASGFAAVSTLGTVIVAQPNDHRFLIFRQDSLARGVGRRGSGPGEFESVGSLGWMADTIWVAGRNSISLFTEAGVFLRVTQLPMSIFTVAKGDSGRFLRTSVFALRADGSVMLEGRNGAGDLVVGWATRDGEMRMPITKLPATICPGGAGIRLPFCTRSVVAAAPDGGRIVAANLVGRRTGQLKVELVATEMSGRIAWRTVVDVSEIPITRRIADSIRGEIAGYRGTPPELAAKIRVTPMAEHFPPVEQLMVGREGGIWLRIRTGLTTSRVRRYDRFGKLLGEAEFPPRLRLLAADAGRAWGILSDYDDLPTLVRVEWSSRP